MSELTVADLMSAEVISVRSDAALDVVIDLMYRHRIRHVPVVDAGGSLVGLVSHTDVVRARYGVDEEADEVREVMVREVATAGPGDRLAVAGRLMLQEKYGCLPVVDGGRL